MDEKIRSALMKDEKTILDGEEAAATVSDDTIINDDNATVDDDDAWDDAVMVDDNATVDDVVADYDTEQIIRTPAAIAKGVTILDTYRVESEALKGGMGNVWRVHHMGWNTDLAMKQPQAKAFQTRKQKDRFIRECDAWINLGLHPHIVSCYYVREIGSIPTIFSEWMDGGSLADVIQDGSLYRGTGQEQQQRLLDIAIQFARGLHYAHEQKLIHQDVKPDNLLLTKHSEVKVADFGIARARAELTVVEGYITHPDGHAGTMLSARGGYTQEYCSWEQRNGKELTRRTDIYSWAVSVMEMYLGERLWKDGVIAGAACESYFPEARVTIPEEMKILLKACLNANEAERPHDFVVIEKALCAIYENEIGSIYARPVPKAAADTADSLNNHALSFLDLGKPEEAEKCWEKALVLDPENTHVHYNQIVHSWMSGRISDREAIGKWEQITRPRPTFGKRSMLANLHLFRGEGLQALRILEKIRQGDADGNAGRDTAYAVKIAEQMAEMQKTGYQITAHDKEVKGLALNKAGNLLASFGKGTEVKVWNLADGTLRTVFTGHTERIEKVCFRPDKNEIISVDWLFNCLRWDAGTGKLLETMTWDPRRINNIFISPYGDFMVVFLRSGAVKTYDLSRQDFVCDLESIHSVKGICFCPDGDHVIVSDEEQRIGLFDLRRGECLQTYDFKASGLLRIGISGDIAAAVFHCGATGQVEVTGMAVSPDNRFLLTCFQDAYPILWDLPSGQGVFGFGEHLSSIFAAFHPDSRYIVFCGAWPVLADRETGCAIHTYYEKETYCNTAIFSNDSQKLIAGKSDGTIQVYDLCFLSIPNRLYWDLSRIQTVQQTLNAEERFNALLLEAEQDLSTGNIQDALEKIPALRAVEGYAASPRWMDIAFRAGPQCKKAGLDRLISIGRLDPVLSRYPVATDGKVIAGGIGKGTIRVWDARSLEPLYEVDQHSRGITSLCFDARGRMASASYDQTVRLWQAQGGACLHTFTGHETDVYCVAITRDGRYIASGAAAGKGKKEKTLLVWDTLSGQLAHAFARCTETVETCCIMQESKSILALEDTGCLVRWYTNGRPPEQFSDRAGTFALSPDERLLAICGRDGLNHLWDLQRLKRLHSWPTQAWGSMSACFSHDGKLLFTGDEDKAVRVWDTVTYEQHSTFAIDSGSDYYGLKLVCSPDDRFMITVGYEDTPQIWYLDWIYQ